MEWDQFLFKRISELVQWVRRPAADPQRQAAAVELETLKPRLTALARLLSGRAVNIHPAEREGGWRGDQWLLPSRYDRAATQTGNVDFFLFRIFFLYGQERLRHAFRGEEANGILQASACALLNADAVLAFLSNEFPGFDELHQRVKEDVMAGHDASDPAEPWLYGRWYRLDDDSWCKLDANADAASKNTVAVEKDSKDYSERQAPAREETELLIVDSEEQENYTLTHNFEKIETLDTFSGRWRDFDGSDDMDEHGEALQELDLRQLVRVDSPVHSVYRTEFIQSLGLIETADALHAGFHRCYDEWNFQQHGYRKGYCRVYPTFLKESLSGYAATTLSKHAGLARSMRRQAERYLTEHFVQQRLSWGDAPDLDAMVEAYLDRKAGITPSENLYQSRRKRGRDAAILVLTDTSLSTDGYSNNQRVLDLEKEALVLVADVWEKLGVRFQLDTFNSRTHNHCNYGTVKGFHESWQLCRDRIGAIGSSGYTRIGPALRHATYLLNQVRASSRWLLLLTDGKPNDYDRYEGQYGIQDVRQAIREAERDGVHVSAIAIEEAARFYLPQMFGKGGFELLRHPRQLPFALLNGYLRIVR